MEIICFVEREGGEGVGGGFEFAVGRGVVGELDGGFVGEGHGGPFVRVGRF